MRGLLAIGAFSDASGLTVKALRHYDATGVLRPAFIDPQTSRRYYGAAQVDEAQLILRLRALDLPLPEIAELLAARDRAGLDAALERHRRRLADEIAARQDALLALERLQARDALLARDPVVVRVEPPVVLLATGMRTSQQEMIGGFNAAMGRLFDHLGRHGEVAIGPPMTRYLHDGDWNPADVRAEIAVPVARPLPGAGAVIARELPAATVAVAVHRGAYERLDEGYAALAHGVARLGHTPAGPPRETYLVGLDRVSSPDELRTELAQPIA